MTGALGTGAADVSWEGRGPRKELKDREKLRKGDAGRGEESARADTGGSDTAAPLRAMEGTGGPGKPMQDFKHQRCLGWDTFNF